MAGDSNILKRVLLPLGKDMSEELARAILSLQFTPVDQKRYQRLSVKANRGTLTREDDIELDRFLAVNDFLAILQAKARALLKRPDFK